ncbi:C-X-C motif chemokine 6 [Heterocephalus glaber]|uniref:C-X-C motif chemokine n=1 Tax=Heterocephalus glaber TaxID=10181 RepID=G5BU05_HETGA|nr:C-X-C motif chemokine 6 [Heterocephalus glaber]
MQRGPLCPAPQEGLPILCPLLPDPRLSHYGGVSPAAGPVATVLRELRCVCLSTTPGIHPKTIANLQVTVSGPKCPRVEVVASLKNGKQVCLDPEAPLIKKVIQKMLDRYLAL